MLGNIKKTLEQRLSKAMFPRQFHKVDVKGEGMQHWTYDVLSSEGKQSVKDLYFDSSGEKIQEYFDQLENAVGQKVKVVSYSHTPGMSFNESNPKYIDHKELNLFLRNLFPSTKPKTEEELKAKGYDPVDVMMNIVEWMKNFLIAIIS